MIIDRGVAVDRLKTRIPYSTLEAYMYSLLVFLQSAKLTCFVVARGAWSDKLLSSGRDRWEGHWLI